MSPSIPAIKHVKMHTQLVNKEQRLQLFIDHVIDVAIYLLDPNGIILTWNSGANRIKGYSSEEIIGKNFSVFYSLKEQSKNKPQAALMQAKIEGRYEKDGWEYRKGGNRFWANVIITPFYNEDNGLIGFGKITRDLTATRQTDLNLRKSLKRNVILLAINQELEEYAFTVAHDIKEPIRGINHYLYLIEQQTKGIPGFEATGMIEAMKNLALKSANLLESLLQVARVGSKDLILENLDLNVLLSDLVMFLQNSFFSDNINICISHTLPHLFCNKIRTRELFYNLIINAIKYNDKKQKNIEIGFISDYIASNGRNKLENVFYIRDNGIGIDKQFYRTVFKSFERLHSRGQFGGGSGLGLSIVQKIIQRHKGKIWIESVVGEGTTFYFTFGKKCTVTVEEKRIGFL